MENRDTLTAVLAASDGPGWQSRSEADRGGVGGDPSAAYRRVAPLSPRIKHTQEERARKARMPLSSSKNVEYSMVFVSTGVVEDPATPAIKEVIVLETWHVRTPDPAPRLQGAFFVSKKNNQVV